MRFNYRGRGDGQRSAQVESGPVKIYISNLNYKIDNKDIEELFSERGRVILKKSAVHYDAEGRSMVLLYSATFNIINCLIHFQLMDG